MQLMQELQKHADEFSKLAGKLMQPLDKEEGVKMQTDVRLLTLDGANQRVGTTGTTSHHFSNAAESTHELKEGAAWPARCPKGVFWGNLGSSGGNSRASWAP